MRVLACVGARPQFVKAAVVSAELAARNVEEILVHTGQHYDASMSAVFFDELALPKPKYELGVGSAPHGAQTAEMLRRLELVLRAERPDWTIVYGDTNTTLAGALAASKLGMRVAHVEAGLRSFNRAMPEEINRIVADHVSDLLLAPNPRAVRQLASEGITDGVVEVGDVMIDLALRASQHVPARPAIVERLGLEPRAYAVATIHRAGNTDDRGAFGRLIEGLRRVPYPVVFPVHPRTRAVAAAAGAGKDDGLLTIDPLPYLDMLALVARARVVLTDSGGLQKEAHALRVPCVTLREETEWVETLDDGWNVLAGSDPSRIAQAAVRPIPAAARLSAPSRPAASRIVDAIASYRRPAGGSRGLEQHLA